MGIILTDWPKYKHLDANYRGMETEELIQMLDTLFHTMMCYGSSEPVGGWVVFYHPDKIKEELKFRKIEVDEYGCNCKRKKE